jgi:hypothetical protein
MVHQIVEERFLHSELNIFQDVVFIARKEFSQHGQKVSRKYGEICRIENTAKRYPVTF